MTRLTYREVATALWAALALVPIGAIALSGGDDGDDKGLPRVPEASGGGPGSRTSFLSQVIPPPPERVRGPRVPSSVADLARRLPLDRKVAQMFLIGFRGDALAAPVFTSQLRRQDFGGIVIANRNYVNPQQLTQLAGEAVVVSQQARHVPPLVFASQAGGDFSEFPDLPPALAPADQGRPRQAVAFARQTAATLQPLGINGLLGPVLDVGTFDGGATQSEAHSDEPAEVAAIARATVPAYRRGGLLAAAKHFPGIGAAVGSPDDAPAQVSLSTEELIERDLVPFRAAIKARVPAIVVGNASYDTDDFVTPASLSKAVTTGLLRRKLRFRGVAITDDLAAGAVAAVASAPDAAVQAVKAGADMVYISGPRGDQEAALNAVLNAVRKGDIKRARINEAVARILVAKRSAGLITRRGKGARGG